MPSMTTYLSKGFFLLPLWFNRRDFSQNFNWLTVNFPICSALTLAQESHQERAQLVLALLARSPCCFEFTARAIKPRLHATSGFFWNRCIWKFVIIKNKLMSVSHAVCPVIDNEFRHNIVTATLKILWRNSWSATRQKREKLTSISFYYSKLWNCPLSLVLNLCVCQIVCSCSF